MTPEEADLAQRYNIPCIRLDLDIEDRKHLYYIKDLIRWRAAWNKHDFQYSAVLWNKNDPRHNLTQINVAEVSIAPGWDKFIENKIAERNDRRQYEEFRKELLHNE